MPNEQEQDEDLNKPSYWTRRAAGALDCAVQLTGREELDQIEKRLDEITAELRAEGR